MKLGVMMVLRNEADTMDEFLQHYIGEGVDHFYIVDNESTDNLYDVLKPYKDIVDVFQWKVERRNWHQYVSFNDNFAYFHRGAFHCDAYKLILSKSTLVRNMDWVIQVNPDEYMYTRHRYNNIKDLLEQEGNTFTTINVALKNFGPGNTVKQPKSIVEGFTWRAGYPLTGRGRLSSVKSITKTEVFDTQPKIDKNIGVHANRLIGVEEPVTANMRLQLFSGSSPAHKFKSLRSASEQWYDLAFIHCNHYQIQSLEHWCKRAKNIVQWPKHGHPDYAADGIKRWSFRYERLRQHLLTNETISDKLKESSTFMDWKAKRDIDSARNIRLGQMKPRYVEGEGNYASLEINRKNWSRADLMWLTNRYETHWAHHGKEDTELRDRKKNEKK
jgi:hypothetical protein